MITYIRGNIFDSKAQAIVNAINCVGVMGAGLAAQFAELFPVMYAQYKINCTLAHVRMGETDWHVRTPGTYIVNFPTMQFPGQRAYMYNIIGGLHHMHVACTLLKVKSIAIPAIGCGIGRLEWDNVLAAINTEFADDDDIDVHVYPPLRRNSDDESIRSTR